MGLDGSSNITALTLDMSDGGTATFNHDIKLSNNAVIDCAGDLFIDVDGTNLYLSDGGTTFGNFAKSSNDFQVTSFVSDGDLVFRGNDGGSFITALTLDMSDGGAAHFTNDIYIKDNQAIRFGDDQDFRIFNDNSHTTLINSVSDQDILFKGNDGGSAITALTIDMSAAGAATFNAGVFAGAASSFPAITINNNSYIGSANNASAIQIATSGDVTFADGVDIITATAGTSNVRFGVNAGNSIVSGGNYNTVVGDEAGTALTTGDANVAVGYQALATEDANGLNTAVGYQALKTLNAGADGYNTAVGYIAGVFLTSGIQNTLIGSLAGDALTDADHNVAIGYSALSSDTLGSKSIAIGTQALVSQNFTGASDVHNVAIGHQAGLAVTTGIRNTFVGGLAGDATDDGGNNTAVGYEALSADCGSQNTAVGQIALGLATGGNNTAIGRAAGYQVTSGSNNLAIGMDALRTGSPGGAQTTASNKIGLGDENITSAHIQVDWTVASDARDKTDFTALDLGLDFVKDLQPVTYKWDKRSKYGDKEADGYDLNAQTPDGTHKEDWLDIGFKAQEVEALEIAAGYNKDNNTNLVSSHTDDGKQMGLQYSKFVPILVKAIQEQQALIESLTARIETLEG
jgi:hypothetical protein